MGGYEMARALKTNPDTHGVPVIFYTAKYHRSEVRRLPDDLATGTVIRKTGEMGALIAAIAAALANAAA
jgi:CheY-like chemotaxis protein